MRDRDWAALKAQAVELRRQGFSLRQIGRRLDVASAVAAKWVAGVPFDGFNEESIAEQLAGHRDPQIYERAMELRQKGGSYNMISAELGVNKSTLSTWFRNEPNHEDEVQQRRRSNNLKAVQVLKLNRTRLTSAMHAKAKGEIRQTLADDISDRELLLLGLMLYWCEGAKTHNHVALANSDPYLIRLFVLWTERCLGLKHDQLRCRVHLYPDNNIEDAEAYWSQVSGIPRDQFHKTQVDIRSDKSADRHGKLYHGTVHIQVTGQGTSNLHRKIMGWIAGFGEFVIQ